MNPLLSAAKIFLLLSSVFLTIAAAPAFANGPYYPGYGPYYPAYAPPAWPPHYRQPVYPTPGYWQPAYAPAPSATPPTQVKPSAIKTPAAVVSEQPAATKKTVPANKSSSVTGKKQAFIEKLLPYIEQQNRQLTAQRQWLLNLHIDNNQLDAGQQDKLLRMAKRYRVDASLELPAMQQALLQKVDVIPASLTLAQAANESAWGESRFAREANNLFGIWTYDADKGLKPKNRESGKKHFVRKFDDIGDSVSYYMHMLNSHPAYQPLREIRAALRQEGSWPDGYRLAKGLKKYSAKGEKYIALIQQLIAQNQWAALDQAERNA